MRTLLIAQSGTVNTNGKMFKKKKWNIVQKKKDSYYQRLYKSTARHYFLSQWRWNDETEDVCVFIGSGSLARHKRQTGNSFLHKVTDIIVVLTVGNRPPVKVIFREIIWLLYSSPATSPLTSVQVLQQVVSESLTFLCMKLLLLVICFIICGSADTTVLVCL